MQRIKKTFMAILTLTILLQSIIFVHATDIPQLLSISYYNDNIQVYLQSNLSFASDLEASLSFNELDDTILTAPIASLEEGSVKNQVHYMFLVENISANSKYSDYIVELSALAGEDLTSATYSLATFRDEFTVVKSDMQKTSDVREALSSIDYITSSNGKNDIAGAIESVFDYYNTELWDSGQLLNVILITDGIILDSDTSDKLDDFIENTSTPGNICIHTLALGSSQSESVLSTLDDLSNGINTSLNSLDEADSAAIEIADFVHNLGYAQFSLTDIDLPDATNGKLMVNATELTFNDITSYQDKTATSTSNNSDSSDNTDQSSLEVEIEESTTAQASNSDADTSQNITNENSSQSSLEIETEENTTTTQESNSGSDTSQNENSSQSIDNIDYSDETSEKSSTIFIIIGIIILVIIVLILLIIFIIRNKSYMSSTDGLRMDITITAGQCRLRKETFYLSKEITIGSNKDCELSWQSTIMPPCVAKITQNNDAVFLVSMQQDCPIYLDGMRIQERNRIRSGNVITIGDCQFSLKF